MVTKRLRNVNARPGRQPAPSTIRLLVPYIIQFLTSSNPGPWRHNYVDRFPRPGYTRGRHLALRRAQVAIVYSLGKLAALTLAIVLLTACGGGAGPTPVALALKAGVCTQGEGPKSKLYIRNLDDYEWRDITLTIMKGEEPYEREWTNLLPESQQSAEPFTDPLNFKWDSDISVGEPSSGGASSALLGPQIVRLRFFLNLDSARIEINSPQPGEWAGAVQPCQ